MTMPTDHTRAAILSAAERLYADRGFADVTLRDIVAAADVNLAAVNYHFGSKDELIAELFVTRSLATNRAAAQRAEGRGRPQAAGAPAIEAILRALVGPTLRGCLGPDNERSTAARFMIRASIESVPPIRRIKNREIDHLRKFAAAMRRSLPDRDEVDLYWGLHFALAMAHQTIRDSERLTKLSEGRATSTTSQGIIDRIVAVSVMALTAREAPTKRRPPDWSRATRGSSPEPGHELIIRVVGGCRPWCAFRTQVGHRAESCTCQAAASHADTTSLASCSTGRRAICVAGGEQDFL